MRTIVTLTPNPAIDGASEADTVRPIHKVRTTNERYDPGGGGINVARVVHELGGEMLAIYMGGGATGAVLDDLLDRRALPRRRVPIADHTRISHSVFERSRGLEYRFVPDGPLVTEAEWRACLAALEELRADYLVLSGSLPRGVPDDFYCRAAQVATRAGAKIVLDTSGEPLRATLEAGGLELVKPSLGEFRKLVGDTLESAAAQDAAALEIVRSGRVRLLAVTMGGEGALLAGKEGVLRLKPPDAVVRSAVGAGDSFVGAMTFALARGWAPESAFAYGVAAGTAATLRPGTQLCSKPDVERLYAQIRERGRASERTPTSAS
ncbi:MAG TPA: 1-phosphofructokinase family hexose kinase [Beijerinckiaceae bacterium]|nr:1-phosphofructokinase family hexose kinase [Beijerinckiaceae bacterium]